MCLLLDDQHDLLESLGSMATNGNHKAHGSPNFGAEERRLGKELDQSAGWAQRLTARYLLRNSYRCGLLIFCLAVEGYKSW